MSPRKHITSSMSVKCGRSPIPQGLFIVATTIVVNPPPCYKQATRENRRRSFLATPEEAGVQGHSTVMSGTFLDTGFRRYVDRGILPSPARQFQAGA